MDRVNAELPTKIYPNRLYALCLAVPCVGLTAGLIWIYAHQSAQAGGLLIGDVILLVGGGVLFGVIALFTLYWLLTPIPLLEFDSSTFCYHQIYLNGVVRWDDLETVIIYYDVVKIRGISTASVDIDLSYRPDAVLPLGHKMTEHISVARRMLPMRPEQLADTIRHFFHDVTYVDERGKKTPSGGA